MEHNVPTGDADSKAAIIPELPHTVDHVVSGGVSVALEVLLDVAFKVPLIIIVKTICTSVRAFHAGTTSSGVPGFELVRWLLRRQRLARASERHA